MEKVEGLSAQPDLRLKWDVFLSFRGEDTRKTFIERIYNKLKSHGIRVFRDNEGMNRGDSIAPSLIEAIKDSAAAITVISPNYATSHWCLEELAEICKCNRLILPVFYQVDPSDVRHQRGPFENSFQAHLTRFKEARVMNWKEAMNRAGGISGWVVHKREEEGDWEEKVEQVNQSLVKRITEVLSNTPVTVAPFIVGLESRVEKLLEILDINSGGVKILVLHGIGGIGKTTLAKVLFNKLVVNFNKRSFVSNIRETCIQGRGLIALQSQMLTDLSSMSVPVDEINAGKKRITEIVHDAKVLVILDDVDDVSQLSALIGKKAWFHDGSRIIITTRDGDVLAGSEVTDFYEVRELYLEDALRLFSYHALKREEPTEEFAELSKQIVHLTGKLPLALEVFGSFLVDKRKKKEWEEALEKLKRIRPNQLQDVLKISYDGLDEQNKCIFLDIACLFIKMKMNRTEVIDILNGCNFSAEIAIKVLASKRLIKITEDDSLWMHDQLIDMGKQIVLLEDPHDPGMRSRLWDRKEILAVLKDKKGTRNTQGIVLDFEEKYHMADTCGMDTSSSNLFWLSRLAICLIEIWKKVFGSKAQNERLNMLSTGDFKSMINLRLLQINHMQMEGEYKFLPESLKWLQWRCCPLKILPPNFCPRELALLDISESKIEKLWNTNHDKVGNMKVLNLSHCYNLPSIPDLSKMKTLEKLILERCSGLVQLHESIGSLHALEYLNLRGCSNLAKFPSDVSGLKNLKNLILSDCRNLTELPGNIGRMKSLKELLLDKTSIKKLPETIFHLTKLEKLDLSGCASLKQLPECIGKLSSLKEFILDDTGLEELPDSVGSLTSLETLCLRWCSSLTRLPDSIGNLPMLKELFTDGSGIKELPARIYSLLHLRYLSIGDCQFPRNYPDSINGLISVVELSLGGKSIKDLPDEIGYLKMLEKLEIRGCESLESLPESIGGLISLTAMYIVDVNIRELPDSVGELENVTLIVLTNCSRLRKLPASIGKLKSLCHLRMDGTAVTELPESFGELTSLITLRMSKKLHSASAKNEGQIDVRTSVVTENYTSAFPPSFSNLSLLEELNARAWYFSGKIRDDFEKLASLESLDLSYNDFTSLPSSLKGLSILKKLLLGQCRKLRSLPPLPSSLQEVNVANCQLLAEISDISDLKSLEELNMSNCERLLDVPGLQCLKSLRRLYMTGCKACSSAVKSRFSKVSLRNLRIVSMPGSEVPSWLANEEVRYSVRENYELKAVLIGVVVSINDSFDESLRDHIPTLPNIRATIVTPDRSLFSTSLPLQGVPKVDEDQVHFCRFLDFHPLVSSMRDGCKIRVENVPMVPGIQLKKGGICLLYDSSDDYDGDEESLDESYQSVSERLARFLNRVGAVM